MRFELKGFRERNVVTAALYESARSWVVMWRLGWFPCYTLTVPKGMR